MALQESFDALVQQVTETEGVEASAVVLINGMVATIADLRAQVAAGSPVTVEQLDALTSRLQAAKTPLSDAVAANP